MLPRLFRSFRSYIFSAFRCRCCQRPRPRDDAPHVHGRARSSSDHHGRGGDVRVHAHGRDGARDRSSIPRHHRAHDDGHDHDHDHARDRSSMPPHHRDGGGRDRDHSRMRHRDRDGARAPVLLPDGAALRQSYRVFPLQPGSSCHPARPNLS